GVKRCSGDDSWWVAACYNSSVPGLFIKKAALEFSRAAFLTFHGMWKRKNGSRLTRLCWRIL
ncbi:MAG: hypothetical protein ACREPR_21320, partial [Brasilonema sp.]